jgi:uncharacterized DUF497 family protein
MGQFQFILWLAYWYLQEEMFHFEWDHANSTKSRSKHGVDIEEVEALFTLRLGVPLGRQVSPEVDEERLCITGPSINDRMVSVVFTLREGKVRPISARPASRKERRLYETIRKTLERI